MSSLIDELEARAKLDIDGQEANNQYYYKKKIGIAEVPLPIEDEANIEEKNMKMRRHALDVIRSLIQPIRIAGQIVDRSSEFLAKLESDRELEIFDRFGDKFKDELKNQGTLTYDQLLDAWNRYYYKLRDTNFTGIEKTEKELTLISDINEIIDREMMGIVDKLQVINGDQKLSEAINENILQYETAPPSTIEHETENQMTFDYDNKSGLNRAGTRIEYKNNNGRDVTLGTYHALTNKKARREYIPKMINYLIYRKYAPNYANREPIYYDPIVLHRIAGKTEDYAQILKDIYDKVPELFIGAALHELTNNDYEFFTYPEFDGKSNNWNHIKNDTLRLDTLTKNELKGIILWYLWNRYHKILSITEIDDILSAPVKASIIPVIPSGHGLNSRASVEQSIPMLDQSVKRGRGRPRKPPGAPVSHHVPKGNKAQIPKVIPLGKYNLYYRSLLNGKISLRRNGKHFNRLNDWKDWTVSTDFINLLFDVLNEKGVDRVKFATLSGAEQDKFMELMNITRSDSVGNMRYLINNAKRKKDIERFEILKGQLLAGNNNPDILNELKFLVVKLMGENQLNYQTGNAILAQILLIS